MFRSGMVHVFEIHIIPPSLTNPLWQLEYVLTDGSAKGTARAKAPSYAEAVHNVGKAFPKAAVALAGDYEHLTAHIGRYEKKTNIDSKVLPLNDRFNRERFRSLAKMEKYGRQLY